MNVDRLKVWALYCDEGDDRLRMSSSAGFALLTQDERACSRFLDELSSWRQLFIELVQAENAEVQRRCIMAIANIVEKSETLAARIMQVRAGAAAAAAFGFARRQKSPFSSD